MISSKEIRYRTQVWDLSWFSFINDFSGQRRIFDCIESPKICIYLSSDVCDEVYQKRVFGKLLTFRYASLDLQESLKSLCLRHQKQVLELYFGSLCLSVRTKYRIAIALLIGINILMIFFLMGSFFFWKAHHRVLSTVLAEMQYQDGQITQLGDNQRQTSLILERMASFVTFCSEQPWVLDKVSISAKSVSIIALSYATDRPVLDQALKRFGAAYHIRFHIKRRRIQDNVLIYDVSGTIDS